MRTSTLLLAGALLLAKPALRAQCNFYPAPPSGLVASYYFNNNLVESVSNSAAGTTNNNAG